MSMIKSIPPPKKSIHMKIWQGASFSNLGRFPVAPTLERVAFGLPLAEHSVRCRTAVVKIGGVKKR